ASEWAEQEGMVAEARRVATELRPLSGHQAAAPALAAGVEALAHDVGALAAPETVARDCRAIHKLLLDGYGLVLQPLAPPELERAKKLYAVACATCHGATGQADTERAHTLKPPPVNFHDPERMARISPALAFHALTFGVSGTSMASFDTLPPSDRWSLAFYVVSLRHEDVDAQRGGELYRTRRLPVAPSASRLAGLDDQQLAELLMPALPDPAERASAIAYLRLKAPFVAQPGGTFGTARRLLEKVSANAGNLRQARELAIAAYLEGIEPHEAQLRAQDSALATRVERAFFDLRHAIDSGAAPDAIRREVARANLILDGADEHGTMGKSVPFFAALAIALREGFELSLLVAALLAFVRKSGHPDYARWIHLGWTASVPAGVATWFAVGVVLAGAQRELTEGVLTLVAAGMLLFVSHFVLGRLESRRWLQFLERKTRKAAAGARGVPWPLVAVAFVAAYREAIEIVLFFRALVLDSPGAGSGILLGAASGAAILAGLVWAMSTLGKRLNPRPLMLASGVVLSAIAIMLVGEGVRALQEGGWLHITPLAPGLSVPLLGIFPSLEGIASQVIVTLLVVLPVWLERRPHAAKVA
ncbi:MAG TPA: FTR1 family protein, partial [Polyangia bacterium]